MEYPFEARSMKHPNDMSLATYQGHSVLQTLIRCYFSPQYRLSLMFTCFIDCIFAVDTDKLADKLAFFISALGRSISTPDRMINAYIYLMWYAIKT